MICRVLCLFLLILALSIVPAAAEEAPKSSLYVKKVENLPDHFIFGMDVSSLIAEEDSGVIYRDFEGNEADVLQVLRDSGITHIRVRVWNDPYDAQGHGYGGGNCDIETAAAIGRRAAAYGMKLIVDFHYSDFWADPGKQMAPKAWEGMGIEEKTEAVYRYTVSCLEKLRENGADVGIVQIGNETNGALCGEKRWFDIQYLMQAGARAVREVCPEALVALHFTDPENAGNYMTYAAKMDYYRVDYDVFATSYYPYWHGSLENLADVLTRVHDTYGKKVMVMETSYAYTPEDSDFFGNTVGEGSAVVKDYPFTVQGQANSIRNITDTLVNRVPEGIGVVYWEGAWIAAGTSSWEENHALWETYGSGWASSYASEYDPADAGKY
ncbi:MAG: glycosyl hydrolase 53 family protein, partial [Clostridia bacterium]|nr:glycosyl hydrolase 53 family protein [Clostridia bacterium]